MDESEYVVNLDNEVKVSKKPKKEKTGDSFKYEKLAKKYVEHLYSSGQFPLYHAGRFYTYTGTHYVEDRELCSNVRKYFKDKTLPQSNNVIGNVVPIIQTTAFRPMVEYPAMPFYTGTEDWPEAKNIIAYRNGLLDLSRFLDGNNDLIPHTPKWCSTFALPFDFDLAASCPLWLQFLDEVFEGDSSRRELLQEWFGYCLTSDTSLEKGLLQVGKSRSGKGTIQYILEQILGAGNWVAYTLGSLAHNFGLSSLVGKAVAIVGEVELSGHPHRTAIMERLKNIIGQDVQEIEVKYDPVKLSVRLPTRFTIACNELPTFFDPSGAIGNRFLFLHHQRSFAGRENPALKTQLLGELVGINNWALQGLARLRTNKGRFTTPDTTRALQAEFDRRSCPVKMFIAERLAVQRCYDPGDLHGVLLVDNPTFIERDRCHELYVEWCQEYGLQPTSPAYFGRELLSALPKKPKDTRPRTKDGKRVFVHHGLGERPVSAAG